MTTAMTGRARIVVTGATGNVGTAVLRALQRDPAVEEIVGIARRRPAGAAPQKVRWVTADVARDALAPLFVGADVVIHLAWLIQPSRDEATMKTVNVEGTRRVLAACAEARVGRVVYASSIGAYRAAPKDTRTPETWPTDGIATSVYSRQKAATERLLDRFETAHPEIRVVRLRPGLVFQRAAASEIRRLFAGPFLPSPLLGHVPIVPRLPRLVVQAVHADDLGDAYRRAALDPGARGAYNVAAEPPLDVGVIARVLGARPVPLPATVARAAVAATWRLRLQPTPPGWLDLALGVPVMDCGRIRDELGWTPQRSADDALAELLDAMQRDEGHPTPPLDRHAGGRWRLGELRTGVGARV